MLPPTVVESNVCPYWFLQMQCTSMRTGSYKFCGMVHPEFIDYDVSEFDEADHWCEDPNFTRGQLQWMVNVQRCRFHAKHGWCKWKDHCEKGHLDQVDMAHAFYSEHQSGAGLVFATRSGLFYERRLNADDIREDIQQGDHSLVPMHTDAAHDWTKLLRQWGAIRSTHDPVTTMIGRYKIAPEQESDTSVVLTKVMANKRGWRYIGMDASLRAQLRAGSSSNRRSSVPTRRTRYIHPGEGLADIPEQTATLLAREPLVRNLSDNVGGAVQQRLQAVNEQFAQRPIRGPAIDSQSEVSSFSQHMPTSNVSTVSEIVGVNDVWPMIQPDDVGPDDSASVVGGSNAPADVRPKAPPPSLDIRESAASSSGQIPGPPPLDTKPFPVNVKTEVTVAIKERVQQVIHGHFQNKDDVHVLMLRINEADGTTEAMLEGLTMLMKKSYEANMKPMWDSRMVIKTLKDSVLQTQEAIIVGNKNAHLTERFITAAKLTAAARLARDQCETLARQQFQNTVVTSFSGGLITNPNIMAEAIQTFIESGGDAWAAFIAEEDRARV